jgi:microsomal dipeptidase-like Zn-dependent dipeptidase
MLFKGGVVFQTLAIFSTTTYHSVDNGRSQVHAFLQLLKEYPTLFSLTPPERSQIQISAAIENASTFATEAEPFDNALKRLEEFLRLLGSILYIGLTWDHENRFGGGNQTNVGLKEDGKRLLQWMSGKKIAIDLSHTSDKLAYDIFNEIDKSALEIPILASHSNFRAVSNYPRNLPDEMAKEIIRRKGWIGLNFFAPFVHKSDPSAIVRHLEYGLDLGGEDTLCFGADFFCDADHPNISEKYQREAAYYPELGDSSTYPYVLDLFAEKLGINEELLGKIAFKNAQRLVGSL